ncbi:transposase [Streptococcus pneumoniae]|uniref:transposase n=1 Tax=Streptococcus pneumoniae TaxID=1313 RepID=UPI001024355E|nr:transposase [Streptococcus pneumoniae]VFI51738.1 mobile genetic element [Streptococcus pneumoniae]
MNDEASKQLTDARFKRLVGVQRTTFEEMLAVLKTAYQLKHAKGGRKPKLSLEDLLMATLQYVRPQAQTPRKSSKLKPLTAEDKACNHALSKERSKVENIFAKVKTFKMFSITYRNHRKRFGLRMNLIAGIINHELGF